MLCLGFGYIQKCTLIISKKPIQSLLSLIADGKTQLAKMGICGMRDEVIFLLCLSHYLICIILLAIWALK